MCDTDHLEPNAISRRQVLAGAAGIGVGASTLAADPALAATTTFAADKKAQPSPGNYEPPSGLAKDSPAKHTALSWVRNHEDAITGLNDRIWEYAEPSLQEWSSAWAEAEFLRKRGFTIEWGGGGLPSTFVATFTEGSGKPVIGFSGEYDALPQLSQKKNVPHHAPESYHHDPYSPSYGYGHGCGHSALGSAAAGAAAAVAAAMRKHGLDGTIKFFGATAEEQLVGKAYAVKRGVYKGLDAFVDWHPGSSNGASWSSSNALESIAFNFTGTNGHGGSPLGNRSAQDAARATAMLSDLLREEHMAPSARLHFALHHAGEVPNVNASISGAWFFVREGSPERVKALREKVVDCARGAAMATRTEMKKRICAATWNVLPIQRGAELMHDNMKQIGPPKFSSADQKYGRGLQESVGIPTKGFATDVEPLEPPDDVFIGGGSTDVADISWNVPTIRMGTAGLPVDAKNHSWVRTGVTGSHSGHVALMSASEYLAAVATDLLTQPKLLGEIKEEHAKRTKHVKWKSMLPSDYQPPVYEPPKWFLRRTKQNWPPEGIDWPPKKTVSKATYSDLGPDLPPANIPPME